ncbi:MAG: toll/interleukin-1 receptor domain-containing protein [Burkholderiales bacterium]
MSRIFISYRREDSDIWAGRLADELRKHFPVEQVFQDIASIDPGADFPTVLEEALATAAVMLVVIGPRWLSATDKNGRKRLESPADFVHQEVAESLRSPAVRVFPLLVNGALMPAEEELPDPLKPLARRNAIELTVRHWASDVAQLVQTLKRSPGVAETSVSEEAASRSANHRDERRAEEARFPARDAARSEETTQEFRSRPPPPSTSAGSTQQGRQWAAPLIALAVLLVLGGGWIAYQRSQDNQRLRTEQMAAEQRAAAEKTAADLTAALKAAAERTAAEQSKAAAEQAAAKKAEALRKVVTEQPARRAPTETADAGRINARPQSSGDNVALLNVGGRWRDNWGVVYTISQDGNAMKVVAEGPSCRGGYFRSTGSGTVTGNSFATTYQSTLPSRGECFGTISASGTRMTSTCRDTVCGQFASSVDRQ